MTNFSFLYLIPFVFLLSLAPALHPNCALQTIASSKLGLRPCHSLGSSSGSAPTSAGSPQACPGRHPFGCAQKCGGCLRGQAEVGPTVPNFPGTPSGIAGTRALRISARSAAAESVCFAEIPSIRRENNGNDQNAKKGKDTGGSSSGVGVRKVQDGAGTVAQLPGE